MAHLHGAARLLCKEVCRWPGSVGKGPPHQAVADAYLNLKSARGTSVSVRIHQDKKERIKFHF